MANEIIKINEKTNVELVPAKIKINGFNQLKEYVENSVAKANNIVTEQSLKGDKEQKTELNKKVKKIRRIRIDIQNKILEPYAVFADQMKEFEKSLENSSDKMKTQIDFFIEKERQAKKELIEQFIEEAAPNYNCEPNEVEIDDKWLNKSTSKKTWEEAVAERMTLIKENKERRKSDEEQLKMTADLLGVDAMPYIDYLNHDLSVIDIQKAMKDDIAKQRAQRAAREASEKVVQDKVIDTSTGEVKAKVQSVTLKLTGTNDKLNALRKYLDNNGIKFEKVAD